MIVDLCTKAIHKLVGSFGNRTKRKTLDWQKCKIETIFLTVIIMVKVKNIFITMISQSQGS